MLKPEDSTSSEVDKEVDELMHALENWISEDETILDEVYKDLGRKTQSSANIDNQIFLYLLQSLRSNPTIRKAFAQFSGEKETDIDELLDQVHQFAIIRLSRDLVSTEQTRVEKDIAFIITEIFATTQNEAMLIANILINGGSKSTSTFRVSLNDVKSVIRFIRITYENDKSWQTIPAKLEVYSVEGGNIKHRVVRSILEWRNVPKDIRRDLTMSGDDAQYTLYP